jgi:hypothetical protein
MVGDKEVSGRSHFAGVFRYLAKFKMSDSSVDSHVANAIEELAASACELIANWTNEGARQSERSDSLFLNHSSNLRSRPATVT